MGESSCGGFGDGAIITVRAIELSFAESPYTGVCLHFSGPCAFTCVNCHSEALWKVQDHDTMTVNTLIGHLRERYLSTKLVEAVCLMGTDGESKFKAAPHLLHLVREMGIVGIVYTGYELERGRILYGAYDYYVCGPYREGEWQDNKRFYRRREEITSGEREYEEITYNQYFERRRRT